MVDANIVSRELFNEINRWHRVVIMTRANTVFYTNLRHTGRFNLTWYESDGTCGGCVQYRVVDYRPPSSVDEYVNIPKIIEAGSGRIVREHLTLVPVI